MWTWVISFASLAFILQAVVSLPSFGTGPQQEQWNEVDDEHPGEIIPDDYMMPMRDPNEHIQQEAIKDFVSKAPEQQIRTANQAMSNIVEAVPQKELPVTEPTPVTERLPVSDKTEEEIVKPLSNPLPQKEDTITNPAAVDNVSTDNNSGRTTDVSVKPEEHKIKPTLLLIARTAPIPVHLPAPNPTPRPPTEDDTSMDCECEECVTELQTNPTGSGNAENNEDCMEEVPSSPNDENVGTVEINNNIKTDDISPIALLRNGRHNEDFEDIFKDVAAIMGAMSSADKKALFKSIPFSKLEEEKMGIPTDEKEMPKTIARIMMRISTRGPTITESTFPFGTKEGENQEYHRDSNSDIQFPSFEQEHKTPTIKGVLLKSLVPREYFAMKDIYDIMKARSAASINSEMEQNEQGHHDIFSNSFESRTPFKISSRYIAMAPKKSQIQTPPLFFPYEKSQSFPKNSEFPDITGLFKSQDSNDDLVRQLIGRVKHPQNMPSSQLPNFNEMKNHIEYNRHMRDFDPEIKNVMNLLLTNLADRESSALKHIRIPQQELFLNRNDDDLRDNGSIHSRRRQFQISFDK